MADLAREQRDRPNAYLEMPSPVRARFVRYEHVHVGAANLAISDIRVFGTRWGGGPRPATPGGLTARRDRDERNAVITWNAVNGVVGYNVRWGIAPANLYPDLPALRRSRHDAGVASADRGAGVLGSDREL